MTILEASADFVCCSFLFFQIGVNLIPVCQIIGNHAIDLRKREAWEILAEHAVERDPGIDNPPCPMWGAEENIWGSL